MLRTAFFGSAQLACPSLAMLAESPQTEVVSVVTQPDRPKGRHLQPHPPPVKVEAQQWQLPVWQPSRCRDAAFLQQVKEWNLDLIVVAAYGQILPAALLEIPRFGALNVHASLLPKFRGAAPIQAAILHDEQETGVTIMKMDAGMDTGDILSQQSTPIRSKDQAESLHDRLAGIGARLLIQTLPDYVAGKLKPVPQPAEGVSYAPKIKKEDGHLDWRLPARTLWNRVRAYTPWPGALTWLPGPTKKRLIKIWKAEVVPNSQGEPGRVIEDQPDCLVVACGEQCLKILRLQIEGGRPMNAREFLAGHSIPIGTELK